MIGVAVKRMNVRDLDDSQQRDQNQAQYRSNAKGGSLGSAIAGQVRPNSSQ
jgi:hypothetical protein